MRTFNYNGNVIEIEAVNENPQNEKDLRVGGALAKALSLENNIDQQVDENGVVWFKAKDICEALRYDTNDINKHLQRHVSKPDQTKRLDSSSGQRRTVNFINESGLYSLILGSQLESAKKFKHWVTSEVLPSIRKTGSYVGTGTQNKFDRTKADEPSRLAKASMMVFDKMHQLANGQSPAPYQYANLNTKINEGTLGTHYKGIRQDMTHEGSQRLMDGLMDSISNMLNGKIEAKQIKESIESKIGYANTTKTLVAKPALPEKTVKKIKGK